MKVRRIPSRAGLSAKMHYFVVNNLQGVCKQRHSKNAKKQVFSCGNLIYAYIKAFFSFSIMQARFLHNISRLQLCNLMLFQNV